MKRKLIGIILSITLLMSMGVTANAEENLSTNIETKAVEKNGYVFIITEEENENHQVIRSYKKDTSKKTGKSQESDIEQAKALLLAMDIEEDTVNSLPHDKLQFVAESVSIQSAVSYIKTDRDNNSVYVDRETALTESAVINERINAEWASKTSGTTPDQNWTHKDSYIEMRYTVLYNGDGKFAYLAGIDLLVAPAFRGWDSLASCTMNSAIIPESRWAEFKYNISTINKFTGETTTVPHSEEPKKFQDIIQSGWCGSGITVLLPKDETEGAIINRRYSGFGINYWYVGAVNYPQDDSNFIAY